MATSQLWVVKVLAWCCCSRIDIRACVCGVLFQCVSLSWYVLYLCGDNSINQSTTHYISYRYTIFKYNRKNENRNSNRIKFRSIGYNRIFGYIPNQFLALGDTLWTNGAFDKIIPEDVRIPTSTSLNNIVPYTGKHTSKI